MKQLEVTKGLLCAAMILLLGWHQHAFALCLPGELQTVEVVACKDLSLEWAEVMLRDGSKMRLKAYEFDVTEGVVEKVILEPVCNLVTLQKQVALREGRNCCDSPNVICDAEARWLELPTIRVVSLGKKQYASIVKEASLENIEGATESIRERRPSKFKLSH